MRFSNNLNPARAVPPTTGSREVHWPHGRRTIAGATSSFGTAPPRPQAAAPTCISGEWFEERLEPREPELPWRMQRGSQQIVSLASTYSSIGRDPLPGGVSMIIAPSITPWFILPSSSGPIEDLSQIPRYVGTRGVSQMRSHRAARPRPISGRSPRIIEIRQHFRRPAGGIKRSAFRAPAAVSRCGGQFTPRAQPRSERGGCR